MRRALVGTLAASFVLIACALGAFAATAKPPAATSAATIALSRNPVVYGHTIFISGLVTGKHAAGAMVTLEANPFPYSGFKPIAKTNANALGHYSFRAGPSLNTIYRVSAKTSPTATSRTVLERVQVAITLGVSTRTPVAGHRVGFSGFVLPAYTGKFALIQRHTRTGWKTVARVKLASATGTLTAIGSVTRSHYSKRLRIFHNDTYRVRFNPNDGARLANNSPTRRLTVH
jgi:hypothetical protein